MRRRCYEEGREDFLRYGAKGIAVCERWKSSYSAFLADMGEAPTRFHSIDRIDLDGDYEPTNCRWATNQEQGANRKTTRLNYEAVKVLRHFRGKRPLRLLAALHRVGGSTVAMAQTGANWPPAAPPVEAAEETKP